MPHVVLPQADVERYEAIEEAAKELIEFLEENKLDSFWIPYRELAEVLVDQQGEE